MYNLSNIQVEKLTEALKNGLFKFTQRGDEVDIFLSHSEIGLEIEMGVVGVDFFDDFENVRVVGENKYEIDALDVVCLVDQSAINEFTSVKENSDRVEDIKHVSMIK